MKPFLRDHYKALRNNAFKKRGQQAGREVLVKVLEILPEEGLILSYSSFNSEAPTNDLNAYLASNQRLVLPRLEADQIQLYSTNLHPLKLEQSSFGMLEPVIDPSKEVQRSDIAMLIIPALAFDLDGYRLGYGFGHYDRFLQEIKSPTVGVGFKEQLSEQPLPREAHDQKVDTLILV